jgi:hypothetical protein
MIAVGGVAAARDPASGRSGVPARPRSAGTPPQGVDIQQSYDRAGDPALIANANVSGDKTRPRWSVCPPPNANVCEPVSGVAPKAGPTSEFLNPGGTAAGTVFQATLTTNGRTYSARTAVWLGEVQATSPPTLSGRPRFEPPVIDNWFTGWYLFAFDHRIAAPFLIAEPGYGSPAVIPTVKLDQTVARSAPLGPIHGPRPPEVTVVRHAVIHGDELLVARVRCSVNCTVRLSVDDHRTGSDARITLTGEKLIGVPRRKLHQGRLSISLQVGAGPEISGHTHMR